MQTLELRAGPRALERIQKNGLSPDDITVLAAAAGGPKGLMLAGVDPFLFGDWLLQRERPLPLIGSSAGAWRVAMACRADEAAAAGLTANYIEQTYVGRKPSAMEISTTANKMLGEAVGEVGAEAMLRHPIFRLQVITARCFGGLGVDTPLWRQQAGGAAAFAANAASRTRLAKHIQRVVFHDPRMNLSFAKDAFNTRFVPLSVANTQAALLASGSIPLLMQGVQDPAGAPAGMYRDGGIVDYQMDLPLPPQNGVVLLPHFESRVVTGWLDKMLKWRRPQNLQDTLVISPSAEFVASLPDRKIPDRSDFERYYQKDDQRIKNWRTSVERSYEMGEELQQLLRSGDIAARLKPV